MARLLVYHPGVCLKLVFPYVLATSISDCGTSAADIGSDTVWQDVISRARYQVSDGTLSVALPPYGVAWLASD